MKMRMDDCLFFDIETTGLSADLSAITIIGCCPSDGACVQWFNEDGFSQKQILADFLSFCKDYKTIISFNGAAFDLPFLTAKIREYGFSDSLSSKEHLDLYQKLRRYRHLFPFRSFRQKNFEDYLGIKRKDSLSGKKVIKAYQSWLKTGDTALKDQILLHNKEDLTGLRAVFQLLCYPSLESGSFTVQNAEFVSSGFTAGLSLRHPFPAAAHFEKDGMSLQIEKDSARFSAKFGEDMTLRHYYPNPKDYYYLPEEDIIIPKSMGSFVDRKARIPASPSRCYSKFKPSQDFLYDTQALQSFLHHSIIYLMNPAD